LEGGDVDAPAPGVDGGNHGGDDGRVVEEATERDNGQEQPQQCSADSPWTAQQLVDQQIDAPRGVQALRHHEHRCHRDKSGIREPRQSLCCREDAGGTQNGQRCHQHEVRTQARKDQKQDCAHRQTKRQIPMPIHFYYLPVSNWQAL
jgi:hypothetical protein